MNEEGKESVQPRADDGQNTPLAELYADPDPRFRPHPGLMTGSTVDLGALDRPIVPLLNALWERGIKTVGSCAGHAGDNDSQTGAHIALRGAGAPELAVAALLHDLLPATRRVFFRAKRSLKLVRTGTTSHFERGPLMEPGFVSFIELAPQDMSTTATSAFHEQLVEAAVKLRAQATPTLVEGLTPETVLRSLYEHFVLLALPDRPGWYQENENTWLVDLDLWLHDHALPIMCPEAVFRQPCAARRCLVAQENAPGIGEWYWETHADDLTGLVAAS